jgi:anti-sigma B factor antagonist
MEGRPLALSTITAPDAVTVHLHGEIDAATAGILADHLQDALRRSPACLRVDMTGVTFCDSSGFRVLVTTAEAAGQQGCRYVTDHPTPRILKLIDLLGLRTLLGVRMAPP